MAKNCPECDDSWCEDKGCDEFDLCPECIAELLKHWKAFQDNSDGICQEIERELD